MVWVKTVNNIRDNIRTRRAVIPRPSKHGERIEMRTPRLFLGVIALALILPLLLLACGGSDEPTDGPSSGQTTAEPTTEGAEPSPRPRPPVGLTPAATAEPTRQRVSPMSTPQPTTEPPMAPTSPETDREALVALYSATGGPNWVSNDSWLSDRPTGEWEGVTTDINGRVTELDLHSTRLSGEIPPELGNLARLTCAVPPRVIS